MNRKDFLSAASGLAGATLLPSIAIPGEGAHRVIKPPDLRAGAVIGITSPAGHISYEQVQPAVLLLESWGYKVKIGDTIGRKDFTFGGTAEERVRDFQQLLDDEQVQAILCARGGYGLVTIIDRLDFSRFRRHPKWVIGFSDITVLHSHIHRRVGVATIHSKMCNSFPDNWEKADAIQRETILSIRDALQGKKMVYPFPANLQNRPGTATGMLVGGNLKTLESLSASASDIKTDGRILFVEDTGEYLYSIDRMFWNLKRSGKLDKLAGLIIGGFKVKAAEDPADEFGKNLQQIVLEKVKVFDYPVCFDFPVGHQKNNFALKCGIEHLLVVGVECRMEEKG